jgi:hypothetical protein
MQLQCAHNWPAREDADERTQDACAVVRSDVALTMLPAVCYKNRSCLVQDRALSTTVIPQ